MAFDAFLKLDGVPGESTDDKHKDEIELLSYSWGATQPTSGGRSTGGAAGAERVNVHDMSVVHQLDKASPKLFSFCASGKTIKTATLTLSRATGDKQKYMEYKMEDVIVSSVRPGGSAKGGDALPLEEVSFNFGKITLTYTATDHKTGKGAGDVTSSHDLVANKTT